MFFKHIRWLFEYFFLLWLFISVFLCASEPFRLDRSHRRRFDIIRFRNEWQQILRSTLCCYQMDLILIELCGLATFEVANRLESQTSICMQNISWNYGTKIVLWKFMCKWGPLQWIIFYAEIISFFIPLFALFVWLNHLMESISWGKNKMLRMKSLTCNAVAKPKKPHGKKAKNECLTNRQYAWNRILMTQYSWMLESRFFRMTEYATHHTI